MHLPESIHPFAHPTLIVVTDSVQAKIFRAEGQEIEPVETLTVESDSLTRDRENIVTGAGDMRSAEPEDHRKDQSREKLYQDLSGNLMHRLQNKEFEEIAITVPHDHKQELEDSLHIDLLKRIKVTIPKLLTNEDLLDLVLHVQEAM